MQNDSATNFIQTMDPTFIFQKNNPWYESMMRHYHEIDRAKQSLDQSTTEEEYETRWNTWNEAYHWWLIRMDQYLCSYNTKQHNLIHEINYHCFRVGQKTGYWNNKYSRRLYDWFQTLPKEAKECASY